MRHGLLFLWFAACGGPVDVDDRTPCRPGACLEGSLGSMTIDAGSERDGVCFSWTVGNDEDLLVNALTAENDGWFHHANWFWVPEDAWDQPDGPWDCAEHGFTELQAALVGGVLFAQSTQLERETQQFLPGYAVRVPAHSRIIANAHLLNWSGEAETSELRTRLDLLDPDAVRAVLSPWRFNYADLDIPAATRTEHAGSCAVRSFYESVTDAPFDVKLHYVLPHFHGLGRGFTTQIVGGPRDGETLVDLQDAWGEPFGTTFPEPIDLSDSDGLRFACEHENDTDAQVGFGIGDQEMCVALLWAESKMMLDTSVTENSLVARSGDPLARSGDCFVVGAPFEP